MSEEMPKIRRAEPALAEPHGPVRFFAIESIGGDLDGLLRSDVLVDQRSKVFWCLAVVVFVARARRLIVTLLWGPRQVLSAPP